MNLIIESFLNFLITPLIRWLVLILNICLIMFAYSQEIVRYSNVKAFTGLPYNWNMFIFVIAGVFGTFLTFLGLWFTIPFTDNLPTYWYIPLFILLIAYYLQSTIDLKPVNNTEKLGEFDPPPTHIMPKKYRILLVYMILILDLLIFVQFYIYFGIFDYSKNTILHRYFLERFGGWYDGHKLAFIIEWIGLGYVINDSYNIYLQKTFEACKYNLPASWNF